MTVPRYRENPLIIKSSMLCPGISQNSKHHHLTLYKGQVWREKPYLELCDHNVLNVVYSWTANGGSDRWPMEENGELSVPPVPGKPFREGESQIAWDSEILQSFTELTNITNITFHYFDGIVDLRKKLEQAMMVTDNFGRDARSIMNTVNNIKDPGTVKETVEENSDKIKAFK